MKTFIKIMALIILFAGFYTLDNNLRDINKTIGIFLQKTQRVEVWEKDNVYIDGTKVNGDCALVDAPCWTSFDHDTIKIK